MTYDPNVPADNLAISAIPAAIRRKGADLQSNINDHITDTTAAHAASAISMNPTGGIGSTDVQAAIAELDTEKAPAAKGVTNGDSHDHNGGDGGTIVYSSLSGVPMNPIVAALIFGG